MISWKSRRAIPCHQPLHREPFYLFLMTIFFGWEKIFKEDGLLCAFCKSMLKPCPNPCCNPQSKDSDPSTSNEEENRDQAFELVFREPSSCGSIQDFDAVKNLERVKSRYLVITCQFRSYYTSLQESKQIDVSFHLLGDDD